MSKYSKLWAAIGGYVVGSIFGYLAWAGLAQCTDPLVLDTCTMFGLSQTAVVNIIGGIMGAIFVERAPANAT